MSEQESKIRFLKNFSLLLAVALSLVIAVVSFVSLYRNWAGSDLFALCLIPFIAAFILCLTSFFQGVFLLRALQEDEELAALRRRKGSTSVLEDSLDAMFVAKAALDRYQRFAPYFVSMVLFLGIGACCFLFWNQWTQRLDVMMPVSASQLNFAAAFLAVLSLLSGVFCVAQSREEHFRWLRAPGGWLIVAAVLEVLVAVSVGLDYLQCKAAVAAMPWVALGCLGVLGLELLVYFVFEFYRPRRPGEEVVPIFESRILSALTEPGGVSRNIADILEYQFGVAVSRDWFAEFCRGAFAAFALALLGSLWLLTSLSEVGPGQMGIRELFGRRDCAQPLPPGVYLKWPWPAGRVRTFPVDMIQEVEIGSRTTGPDGKHVVPEVILWTKQHYAAQSMYLMATKIFQHVTEEGDSKAEAYLKDDKGINNVETPVAFIVTSAKVQYRIRPERLFSYAYDFANPQQALQELGESVLVNYLAGIDFIDLMSVKRQEGSGALAKLIQAAADQAGLGVEVVMVNLLDSHPPIEEVAPSFEAVIGAQEEMETSIQAARTRAVAAHHQGESEARKATLQSEGYRAKVELEAAAEVDRFDKQLMAYQAEPAIFKLRSFLGLLEEKLPEVRKYVMSSNLKRDVYTLDLTEKPLFNVFGDAMMDEATSKKNKEKEAAAQSGR